MMVRFADVEFDWQRRSLTRNGREVHVSIKAFDLLHLLIERRPDPVSKADIRKHLWPDTFVSETNLPTLVAELREAIGDDAKHPRFVKTLHRIGYAFRGEVAAPRAEAAARPRPAAGWLVGPSGRVEIYAGENILGREGSDVIVLASPTVSRRHARITMDPQGAAIEDLNSKNGTYVNDRPVTSPLALSDGDQVRAGSLTFTFRVARAVRSTQTA
jgi:DNA-binding winged helix-turn-helix (wHTH) protein